MGKKIGLFQETLKAALVFTVISFVFCLPIFNNFNYWGQMDWDQFTFWNAVPRATILSYHQFPLWNPYSNGGNVMLAHPHSSFLTPFYIFVLMFGPVAGLKLEILVHLAIGMMGMFFLSKYLKLDKYSSSLPSIIFMLSAIYPLHLTEGHAEWLAMAFLPWVFLSYLKSTENKKYIIIAAIFLSLMLFGGSVDVLSITLLFLAIHSFIRSLQERKLTLLKNFSIILICAFLLSAVKLLPMLEFIRQFPRLTDIHKSTGVTVLLKSLLSMDQAEYYSFSKGAINSLGLDNGWHEYGAYIGVIPLALFLVGFIIFLKKELPILLTGWAFLFISLGNKMQVNLWDILHSFPVFDSLSCPSRFILGFIFCISLVSGMALSRLGGLKSNGRSFAKFIIPAIVLAVAFDLIFVNFRVFKQAFVIQPLRNQENKDFAQRYADVNFYGENVSRSSMYPVFLSNSGILNSYEVISVKKGGVLTTDDPHYEGEVYLRSGKGQATVSYFSPNKVVINVNPNKESVLVLNQNYYNGWRVAKRGGLSYADSYDGLIATKVNPEDKIITFFYLPNSFFIGALISAASILYLFSQLRQRKEKNV